MKRRSTAADRILAALRAGDKTTAELASPEIGGVRFSARIMELRDQGHVIHDHVIRQGSWRYTLAPSLTVVEGDRSWRLPPGPWFSVCDREGCGQRWTSPANPPTCPSCGAGVHWISSFTHKDMADDHLPLYEQDRLAEKAAA